jgi:hypothetical protein
MKVTTVTVHVQKTVQAAQFEPVVIGVTLTAELEAGDKVSKVKRKLYESASESVHELMPEEIKLWRRNKKKSSSD